MGGECLLLTVCRDHEVYLAGLSGLTEVKRYEYY